MGLFRKTKRTDREIFDQYEQHMMSVAVRYVGSTADAQDVLQEAFIRIFKNIRNTSFDQPYKEKSWVIRITVNEALRWLKRRKSRQHSEVTPADAVCYNREKLICNDLFKMINSLPEGYKITFNMYAIEGYSHQEIAEMLGISPSTSRSQVARARKLLQSKLELHYERS